MYDLDGLLSNLLQDVENKTFQTNQVELNDHIEIFCLYQDSNFLLLLHNKGSFIKLPELVNDIRYITYYLTVRFLSISQIAFRINLMGYPQEALALSRLLTEIVRINTYLNFNPDKIDDYLTGKLKATKILALAGEELSQSNDNPEYQLWKFLSSYSHATPNLLEIFTEVDKENNTIPLIIQNHETLESVASGIILKSLTQYAWFRMVFKAELEIPDGVIENDKKIFTSELNSMFGDNTQQILSIMYQMIYS